MRREKYLFTPLHFIFAMWLTKSTKKYVSKWEERKFPKKMLHTKNFVKEMNSTNLLQKDSRGHHFVEFSLPRGLYKRKRGIN